MADHIVYTYAEIGLNGLPVLPLTIIWLASLCAVLRRADPARWGFTWMKLAIPLIVIALALYVGGASINSILFNDEYYDIFVLDEIESRLFDAGLLFEQLGNIALILCLTELGLGFIYIWKSSRSGHFIVRVVAAFAAVALLAVNVARYARVEVFYTNYYEATSYSDDVSITHTMNLLNSAVDIILFVIALAILALAIAVLSMSRGYTQLRSGAVIYFFIGLLNLLRSTWSLIYDAAWVITTDGSAPVYTLIVNAILDTWVVFIILILIFILGCRKRDGFWSTKLYGAGPLPPAQHVPQNFTPYNPQSGPPHELQPVPQNFTPYNPQLEPPHEFQPLGQSQQSMYYNAIPNQDQYRRDIASQYTSSSQSPVLLPSSELQPNPGQPRRDIVSQYASSPQSPVLLPSSEHQPNPGQPRRDIVAQYAASSQSPVLLPSSELQPNPDQPQRDIVAQYAASSQSPVLLPSSEHFQRNPSHEVP